MEASNTITAKRQDLPEPLIELDDRIPANAVQKSQEMSEGCFPNPAIPFMHDIRENEFKEIDAIYVCLFKEIGEGTLR